MRACSTATVRPSSASPVRATASRARHLLFAIAAVGLLSLGPAAAQEPGETAAERTPAKPGKSNKVCKHEAVTGSRMKKRVCYTPEQWEARERASKSMARELDSRPISERGSD